MKSRRLPSEIPSLVKIGEASKILGVSIDTLRRWEKAGKISPIYTPGGTQLYSLNKTTKTWHIKPEKFQKNKTYTFPQQTFSFLAATGLFLFLSLAVTTPVFNSYQLAQQSKSPILGLSTSSALSPTVSQDTKITELEEKIANLESLTSAQSVSISSLNTSLSSKPQTLDPGVKYTDILGETIIDSGGNIYPAQVTVQPSLSKTPPSLGTWDHRFYGIYANGFDVTPYGNLTVYGPTTISNTLSVTGTTSFTGDLTFNDLTASRVVFTDSNKALTSSATSAVLASSITDETGSGLLVLATSPTLTTPAIGAATATSINSLTITTSTGTLTIPNSKTISFADAFTTSGAYSLTLTTTASTNVTLPTTGTLATLGGTETFSGTKTFSNATYSALFTGGNVGIGTTAPGSELEIYSADSTLSGVKFSSSTAGTNYSIGVADGTPFNDALVFISNTTQYAFMNSSGNWGFGFAGIPGSRLSASGNLSLGSSYVTIAAPTNGAIIEGNVGIGTTNPTTKLDVSGTVTATAFSGPLTGDVTGNASTATALASDPSDCGANSYATTIATSGNLTCSQPAASNLSNGTTGTGAIVLASSPSITTPTVNTSLTVTDDDWIGLSSSAGQIAFDDQTTDFVNILNANVGIGTTAPGAQLHLKAPTDSSLYLRMQGNGTGSGSYELISGYSGGSKYFTVKDVDNAEALRLMINNTGDVGIGGAITDNIGLTGATLVALANGNVGIGTTNPGSIMEVKGASPTLTISNNADSTDPTLWLRRSGYDPLGLKIWHDDNVGYAYIDNLYDHSTESQIYMRVRTAGTPVNALTIIGSGNVGIGTTGPIEKLQVAGNIATGTPGSEVMSSAWDMHGSLYRWNNFSSSNFSGWSGDGNGSLNVTYSTFSALTQGNRYQVSFDITISTGSINFILGSDWEGRNPIISETLTTSKHYTYYVTATRTDTINANFGHTGSATVAVTNFSVKQVTNGNILVGGKLTDGYASGGINLINGNVGIGTTNPGVKLDVSGSSTTALQTIIIRNTNTAAAATVQFDGYLGITDGTVNQAGGIVFGKELLWEAASSSQDGYIMFQTTQNAGGVERMRIASDGTFTGSASNDISDARMKTNVATVGSALEKIMQLRGVSFNWKEEAKMTERTQFGVIAQEVEAVFPELVLNTSIFGDGYKSVQYGGFVAPFIEAIKELSTQQTELLTRITDLEADVAGIATSSGELDDLVAESASSSASYFSSVEISESLRTMDATISGTFRAFGDSFLGNTLIAGDLIVDGTLSFTGNSISSIGTLFLQNGPLDTLIDIFNGKVQIDNSGKVSVHKLGVSSDTLGAATLPSNQTELTIDTDQVASTSAIFITPKSSTSGQSLYIKSQTSGTGFSIGIDNPVDHDINFNWWIVDAK